VGFAGNPGDVFRMHGQDSKKQRAVKTRFGFKKHLEEIKYHYADEQMQEDIDPMKAHWGKFLARSEFAYCVVQERCRAFKEYFSRLVMVIDDLRVIPAQCRAIKGVPIDGKPDNDYGEYIAKGQFGFTHIFYKDNGERLLSPRRCYILSFLAISFQFTPSLTK